MSTRISVNEPRMNTFFDRVMDEIYFLFHYHPLSFPSEPIGRDELSEMNYYQSMGRAFYQNVGSEEDYTFGSSLMSEPKERVKRFRKETNPKFSHLHRTSR